jgi:hypothetical protein
MNFDVASKTTLTSCPKSMLLGVVCCAFINSFPRETFSLFNRFAAKYGGRLKLLENSTYSDYLQPYKDTQGAFFELLSVIPVSVIPNANENYELSEMNYLDSEALSDTMSCPICIMIQPLGMFYKCVHESCSRCVEKNEQKTCPMCRKPRRPSSSSTTNARLDKINTDMASLLYNCPCKSGRCPPTRRGTEHGSCIRCSVCPLMGTGGCTFTGPPGQYLKHLRMCHPMEHLWKEYQEVAFRAKINQNPRLSGWCDKSALLELLITPSIFSGPISPSNGDPLQWQG